MFPKHILLVEDNEMDAELTLNAIEEVKPGSTVTVASTGEQALDYLCGNGEYNDRRVHPMPDLILLDIGMPGVDGHQVLEVIKETPLIKRLPVVILTSSQEYTDRARGYDNGVNSYVIKPISYDGFLRIIRLIARYWLQLNAPPPLQ
jgi:CheY-like chemotaxis protein